MPPPVCHMLLLLLLTPAALAQHRPAVLRPPHAALPPTRPRVTTQWPRVWPWPVPSGPSGPPLAPARALAPPVQQLRLWRLRQLRPQCRPQPSGPGWRLRLVLVLVPP